MKLLNRTVNWIKVGAGLFFIAGVGLAVGSAFVPVILPAALICFAASYQLFKQRKHAFKKVNDEHNHDPGYAADADEELDVQVPNAMTLMFDKSSDFMDSNLEADVQDCCTKDDNQTDDRIVPDRLNHRRRRKRH